MKVAVDQFDPLGGRPAAPASTGLRPTQAEPAVDAQWPPRAAPKQSEAIERLQRLEGYLHEAALRMADEIEARQRLENELEQRRAARPVVRAAIRLHAASMTLNRLQNELVDQSGAADLLAGAQQVERERRQELLFSVDRYLRRSAAQLEGADGG